MTLLSPTTRDSETLVLDALPLVPYRERRLAMRAEDPAPGRYLLLEDGDERALLPLPDGATRLGRAFDAELRLDDQSVSRRHAIIFRRATGARIIDDRSANGTFVNGRRVGEAELHDGDVIVLGRVVLTYLDVPPR
jgi:pSer/pThr/pTyr-binding forkhead associated (FHA) protein